MKYKKYTNAEKLAYWKGQINFVEAKIKEYEQICEQGLGHLYTKQDFRDSVQKDVLNKTLNDIASVLEVMTKRLDNLDDKVDFGKE